MRTILTDDYIHEKGNLYQTIPLGVEVPHIQDQSSDKTPAGQKKAILKKSKNIKPRQQVESVLVDAINGLSASGDPKLMRKTAENLYLQIESRLYYLRYALDNQDIAISTYTGPEDRKIFDDLLNKYMSGGMYEMLFDERLIDMTEAEKLDIINQYEMTDDFIEFVHEKGPRTEEAVRENIKLSAEEEAARIKISTVDY